MHTEQLQLQNGPRFAAVGSGERDFHEACGGNVPQEFGAWSGDEVAAVAAEQGIKPLSGERMLRFLRAAPRAARNEPALVSSEQWQLIDLQPWREKLAGGGATLEFAAWFNRAPLAASTCRMGVGVFACRGPAANARQIWRNYAQETLAHAGTQIIADDDPATWERTTAQIFIPEETDFLVIVLSAIRRPLPPNAPPTFEGHYADAATLALYLPPRPALDPQQ